ncbi:hypothetical protein [Amycolatopsis sp. lyj-112]|uniref:hypothetical protein n=1 Tax=Amycolatopsis sp. lyj-112 TaxID=2789288 RepID=UPI0039794ABE
MRPYVAQAQNVPWIAPRLAAPRTRAGIRLLTTLAGVAARPRVGRIAARFTNPPSDSIDLPAYAG